MKTAQLHSVTMFANGSIEVRLTKLSSDGDDLGPHFLVIEADEPLQDKQAALAQNLADMGIENTDETAIAATLASVAAIARTPEKIQARKAVREAEAQASAARSEDLSNLRSDTP